MKPRFLWLAPVVPLVILMLSRDANPPGPDLMSGRPGDRPSGAGSGPEHDAEARDLRPQDFFQDWYAPYSHWSPEMQLAAVEAIRRMEGDDAVMVRDKKGRLVPASHQPWVQKGPAGMVVGGTDPLRYWSGKVISLDHHPARGLYIGSAEGGLWKPFIGGLGYVPASDGLPSASIGGVAVHHSNPDIMFVGTGEYPAPSGIVLGGIYETFGTGVVGTGVYRTTDGGATWEHMPLVPTPETVSRMLIPAWAESIVFAATNRGLYRSTDLGATWARMPFDGYNFSKSISDLATTSTGNYMLAGVASSNPYASADSGATWEWVLGLHSGESSHGRSSVAISPSHPGRAYVQIGHNIMDTVIGVFKTTDGGVNWTEVTPPPSALSGGKTNYLAQQDGNNAIVIHPTNPDIVWAGGVYLMRSSNGGATWDDVGATGAGPKLVHPDIEVLKYIDDNTLVVGCHGGVFYTTDEGQTWSSQVNRFLPITQFYNTDIERNGGRTKTGGAQDNGLVATTVDDPDTWHFYAGGDGIDAVVNQQEPTMTYGTGNGSNGGPARHRTTGSLAAVDDANGNISPNDVGQSFWNTYMAVDPKSTRTVFTNAGQYVYMSKDSGTTWSRMNAAPFEGVIRRVSANKDGDIVYAATRGAVHQRLWRFHWAFGQLILTDLSAPLMDVELKRVHPSSWNPYRAYAVAYGIGDQNKIFKTTDAGDTWTNITANLPDIPVNDVVDDYNNPDVLYCGTDKGAFRSVNGGASWQRWNAGMPEAVRVMDLEYVFHPDGDYIFAGTFGRSTFERPVGGYDPIIVTPGELADFGSVVAELPSGDSCVVSNGGTGRLEIFSIRGSDASIEVRPASASLEPAESLKIFVTFTPPRGASGPFRGWVELMHNADDSPTRIEVQAYVGDATPFRSFPPESLAVNKEVKRKIASTSWCFRFDNSETHREGAHGLVVEFANPVAGFASHSPFATARQLDDRGKKWMFTDGLVQSGLSALVCGFTPRTRMQEVSNWWWTANLVVWENGEEHVEEGVLGAVNGPKLPVSQAPGLDMPNAANLRNEVFLQYPVNADQPFIIGVGDPTARENRLAYVAIARSADLFGSLIAARTGRQHAGPARPLDYFDNGREMIGRLRKLSPDQQDNKLFAQLAALKLNISASALGKTPAGFGELRYLDETSPMHGLLIRQIDSAANRYMTYFDSSVVGSGVQLYDVVRRINEAFVGPMDTVSFSQKLVLTGVRPVAEVPFLERDPSIAPRRVEPRPYVAGDELPVGFVLHQNYPNPFNPTTTIRFDLGQDARVTLKVYNVMGQEMATLFKNEEMEAGEQEVTFDAAGLPSGVYFCRLVTETPVDPEAGTAMEHIKMLLVR